MDKSEKLKILIVEDDNIISDMLSYNLEKNDYATLAAYDGDKGLKYALEENPDLILLDVMLPGMNGFDVCKKVREVSQVPIIMLTAREDESDKILGLDSGADDYVTKPFSVTELIARIRANIRRRKTEAPIAAKPDIEVNNLKIFFTACTIHKNGKEIDLSAREFDIIKFLASQPNKVFSREELMEKVWGYEYYGDLRAVDVAMRRLREKIEDDPSACVYILTRRGFGYYFKGD